MRLKSTLTAMALSLSAIATPAAPVFAQEQDKPEPARVYKDWVVGCHLSCEAVVVLPEGDAEGYVLTMSMMVREYIDVGLDLTLHDPIGETLPKTHGPYRLLVDGKALATFAWSNYTQDWRVSINRSNSIILARGKLGEIVDKDGKRVSYISLSGATAAMRDMDQRMGIAGYPHALVARGKKRGGKPIGPSDSVFARNPTRKGTYPVPPDDLLERAVKASGCEIDRDETDARFDTIHPLEIIERKPEQILILVGCGHGAYNYMVMPLMATKNQLGLWTVGRVKVENYRSKDTFDMPLLTNATWNADEQTLTHYHKGRGLGDCGDSAVYHLSRYSQLPFVTEIREMPVCRGATYWPHIW